MGIIRKVKIQGFTTISNDIFHDYRLSFKAKGLFCQLMSLPDDWHYSLAGLAALSSDKVDSVRTAVNELKLYGYLDVIRLHDEKGAFRGVDYIIYESLDLKQPLLDSPILDSPILAKPTQLNTKKELNTYKDKKQKSGKFSDFEQTGEIYDYNKFLAN